MSYQVLARKYRPQSFGEVIGQVHVTQTLQNALTQKRLHHAYLFTGARGVGKTTVARILAKALNCEKGVRKEPCNQCGLCTEILEGKSLDVQEIDGASNTGVDDVRKIREQVKYMPAKGRYKIYIIDEVHMLSTSAFNALLKTLEEPPAHVIFVFATTEPHKIPATILSRCQRYDFRRIQTRTLAAALKGIAASEGIEVEEEALHLMAREAAGSLRDGQSLLDQAIAFAGNRMTYEHLKEMLGFLDRHQLWTLLEGLLQKDRQAVLEPFQKFYQTGVDLNRLAQDLLESFRNLYLIRSLNAVPEWLDLPNEELDILTRLSEKAGLTELDQLFQLAYRGVEELARSPFPKMFFEVLLVRMTQVAEVLPVEAILEKLEEGAVTKSASTEEKKVAAKPTAQGGGGKDWDSFIRWIERKKPQLASIINHGKLIALEEKLVTLGFEPQSIYGEMLQEEDRQEQFQKLFTEFFGRPLKIKVILQTPKQTEPRETAEAKEKRLKEKALRQEAVKEATHVLGAVVEDVRMPMEK